MKCVSHKGVGPVPVKLVLLVSGLALSLIAASLHADQVEMQNGDRYVGKVLSLNNDTLVLQNEVLGTVRLPRGKVATINLGVPNAVSTPTRPPRATNTLAHAPALAGTNAAVDLSAAFRQLGANTNLIHQIQTQFLSGAGPEANAKFNELMSGLMSGTLNLNDLRAQAQSTLEQARAARRELGDEAGPAIDGYLSILDSFLKETESLGTVATNAPPRAPKPNPLLEQE